MKAPDSGYSALEVLLAISLLVIVAGAAIPMLTGSLERSRSAAAARYVASRLALARFEAVKRSSFVAIRFVEDEAGYCFRTYVDGDGDGVQSLDIAAQVDVPITTEERLDYHFPGVTFGIQPNGTSLDPGEALDAGDPVQIGPSPLLSFNPNGSSTSGTLFVRGTASSQFAVRVLGATGRIRVFEFVFEDATWRMR